jgi:hypothetical protein
VRPRTSGRRWPRRTALGLLCAATLAGCASAPAREARIRDAIAESRYRDAAEAAAGERDELLRHLDRGLALLYAGDAVAANLHLGRAEVLIDERYTRSVSRAAFSLLLNDRILPYQPDAWERLMIPLYRALSYMTQDAPEDAAVEARRLSSLLLERRDRRPARAAEENDAFLYVVAGAVLEWAGRPGDAEVAYRNAREAYGAASAPADWLAPEPIQGSLLAAGEAAAPVAVAAGEPEMAGGVARARGGDGELMLLVETGQVPPPVEELLLVYLAGDEVERAREHPDRVGQEIAKRYLEGRSSEREGSHDYLLPIALRARPIPPFQPARAVFEVDGARLPLPVAFDVSRAAAFASRDELPALLAKTAARAVVKTLAFKETTDHADDVVRILANAVHLATERADTRAWLTLPGELRFARVPLAPGPHAVRVRLETAEGSPVLDLGTVQVESGRPTLVRARMPERDSWRMQESAMASMDRTAD